APTTMGVYLGADVGLAVNTYKDVTKSTKADFLFDIHAGFRWRFLDARVGTFVPTVRSSLIKDNFGIWISLGYRFHL
ncbi:MAG: hypothetical protein KC492_23890, partial [Myxococcales bacterium]|nr:hypothetical protein [Myxococcales bacterium]